MRGREGSSELRRIFADFAFAFVLLCTTALLVIGAGHNHAHAVPLPAIDSRAILEGSSQVGALPMPTRHASPDVHKAHTSPAHAQLLLSLALAAIVAFNLAFWRHLRRVYASPRRNVWRRG